MSRTPEETKNQLYTNFIVSKDYDEAKKALQKVFRDGYVRTELDFVSKNEKITPILLIAFRYQVDDDIYATGIGINISDKKQAIEELEHKEQKLKEAQRIGRMGSWIWNIPENDLQWSDEVFEIYGLDKETFQPSIENYWKLLPESEVEKVNNIIQRVREGKEWEDVEIKVKKPDGSIVYIHERAEMHFDNNGILFDWNHAGCNISQRK